ncbi:MAG: hypothetical protein P4N41_20260 [Negativicutes bacterium]|nr:hypothetical protein [Negativicutes bacterium]
MRKKIFVDGEILQILQEIGGIGRNTRLIFLNSQNEDSIRNFLAPDDAYLLALRMLFVAAAVKIDNGKYQGGETVLSGASGTHYVDGSEHCDRLLGHE